MIVAALAALTALVVSSAPDPDAPADPIDAASPSAATGNACRADGKAPALFAIGGSSMQNVFGPMLSKRFGKQGMRVDFLGKSASGLARTDYFDWPTTVRDALAAPGARDPDVFVVDLGSNDGQSLRDADGTWTRLDHPDAWRAEYAARVDAFLALAAGAHQHRAVIWIGPAAHSVDEKRARGKVVGDVIRERVQAFAGRAWYIDLWSRSATASGGALWTLPDGGDFRTKDGFHFTRPGIERVMFDPLAAILAPCYAR